MSTINSNAFPNNMPNTAVPPGVPPSTNSPQADYETEAPDDRSSEQLSADADRFSSLVNERNSSRDQVAPQRDSRDNGGDGNSSSDDQSASSSDSESANASRSVSDVPVQEAFFRNDLQAAFQDLVGTDTEPADSEQTDNAPPAAEPEFSGQAILQSFAPQLAAQPVAAASATPNTSAAASLDSAQAVDALATQIADRILVSDPATSGTDEVRILLKDAVLPQTEVRFSREGGALQVEFVTQSDASFDLLEGHQTTLQDRLSRKTDQPIKVAVTHGGQQDASSDGRSRQRQEIEVEEASSKSSSK